MAQISLSLRENITFDVSRTHQASDIAKLWQEFLSLQELIACIGCAVVKQKSNVALGNTHKCVLPLPQ